MNSPAESFKKLVHNRKMRKYINSHFRNDWIHNLYEDSFLDDNRDIYYFETCTKEAINACFCIELCGN